MIILLPFTVTYNIITPFIIWLIVDILWIFILLSIPNPKVKTTKEQIHKWFFELFKEAKIKLEQIKIMSKENHEELARELNK